MTVQMQLFFFSHYCCEQELIDRFLDRKSALMMSVVPLYTDRPSLLVARHHEVLVKPNRYF